MGPRHIDLKISPSDSNVQPELRISFKSQSSHFSIAKGIYSLKSSSAKGLLLIF